MYGCQQVKATDTISWRTLYKSHQCSIKEPSAQLLNANAGELIYLEEMSHLSQRLIGQQTKTKEVARDQSVLVIAMGQKNSGGYGVNVENITIWKNTLKIQANWQEPGPDSMTTSALTSPCEIITLDRAFSDEELAKFTIEITNRKGKTVMSEMNTSSNMESPIQQWPF
jgi:hypothetical protein